MSEARTRVAAAYAAARTAILDDPATAELALQRCLDATIDAYYAHLGVAQPPIGEIIADLNARDPRTAGILRRYLRGPDTRARYIFLGDLLEVVQPGVVPAWTVPAEAQRADGASARR